MFEWYDFTVYALFAGYIAGNFFPGDDSNTRLLKTFLVFGLGFVVRAPQRFVVGQQHHGLDRRLGHRHSIENVAKWHGRTAIQHHAEHFKG